MDRSFSRPTLFGSASILDDERHYGIGDLIERYVTQVEHVLGLDWFHPEKRLLSRIDGYFDDAPGKGRALLRVVE